MVLFTVTIASAIAFPLLCWYFIDHVPIENPIEVHLNADEHQPSVNEPTDERGDLQDDFPLHREYQLTLLYNLSIQMQIHARHARCTSPGAISSHFVC